MKYGQNFRFGFYDIHPKDRMKAIKDAGFSSVMQWWGDDFEDCDGDKWDIASYAKDCNLTYSALHAPSNNSSAIWLDTDIGEQKFFEYMSVLEACNKLEASIMVMHLTHRLEFLDKSDIGIERIQKLANRGEELGVFVALENTRKLDYNAYVFNSVNSNFLKACFDSGHNNCYTPYEDAFTMFQDKIVLTHFHDNYGPQKDGAVCDLHNLMGDGTVDWLSIREKILTLSLDTICLESYCRPNSKYYGLSMSAFLELSYAKITTFIEKGIVL